MKHGRICIYPKDVMQYTGKCMRTCQNLLSRIKRSYGKDRHQHITFQEFADYMKIRVEDILMVA